MPEVMNAWPSTARGLQPGRFQKGSEQAVNFPVDKRLPFLRNEDVVATPTDLLTTGQVVAEPATAVSCKGTNRVF
jgi:hypothetical protein